jgi:hypothetical protein
MWKGGGLPERHSPVTEGIAIKNADISFIFIQLFTSNKNSGISAGG